VKRVFIRLIVLGGLTAAGWNSTYTQSAEMSAMMVLRSQARSIAEEVVTEIRARLPDTSAVGLNVAARLEPMIVENGFLDVLNSAGFKPWLVPRGETDGSLVQVNVLHQMVRYSAVPSGLFERVVQTTLEARFRDSSAGEVIYLGNYQRSRVDTVLQREDPLIRKSQGRPGEFEELSFFEKVAGPVLMITGAFLIVYLFFTVRN